MEGRGRERKRYKERRVPQKVDDVDGNVGRANSSGKFNLRSKRGREGGTERGRAEQNRAEWEVHFRIYNVQNAKRGSRVEDERSEEEGT